MRFFRWALVAGLIIVLASPFSKRCGPASGATSMNRRKPLEAGEQEIALIEPATSTDG